MQPATQPNAANAVPARPIQDVKPTNDSLGNPQHFEQIPVHQAPTPQIEHFNPISGPGSKQPSAPRAAKNSDLETVLKDVNKDVKTTLQKPVKTAMPILVISVSVVVALILSIGAFYALRNN